MKFTIRRTSDECSERPPIDKKLLTFEKYDSIDVYTCTEEYFNERNKDFLWRSMGVDHKTCHNGDWIQRTLLNNASAWFIEINTLEELMALIESVKEGVIIDKDCCNYNIPSLEIYDDYRE